MKRQWNQIQEKMKGTALRRVMCMVLCFAMSFSPVHAAGASDEMPALELNPTVVKNFCNLSTSDAKFLIYDSILGTDYFTQKASHHYPSIAKVGDTVELWEEYENIASNPTYSGTGLKGDGELVFLDTLQKSQGVYKWVTNIYPLEGELLDYFYEVVGEYWWGCLDEEQKEAMLMAASGKLLTKPALAEIGGSGVARSVEYSVAVSKYNKQVKFVKANGWTVDEDGTIHAKYSYDKTTHRVWFDAIPGVLYVTSDGIMLLNQKFPMVTAHYYLKDTDLTKAEWKAFWLDRDPDYARDMINADSGVELDDNTYMLRVGTGENKGKNVLYLGIRYEDMDGEERTEFLFPHEGSLDEGYSLARFYGNPDERLGIVESVTGYTVGSAKSTSEGLEAYSDDTYLFQPQYKFKKCLGIDVMMRYPMDASYTKGWTCTGMYLYHVTDLYGVDMAGYYSKNQFISFKGEMINRMTMEGGKSVIDFELGKSDRLYRIGRETSVDYGWETIASNSPLYNYDSQSQEFLFKIDLADNYEAGVEALASFYYDPSDNDNLNDRNRLREVAEAINLTISYTDVYGKSRSVVMPVVTSTLSWLVEEKVLPETLPIAGVAQQGQSLMFPGILPDVQTIQSFRLHYGMDSAGAAGISAPQTNVRKTRQNMMSNSSIRVDGLQIYSGNLSDGSELPVNAAIVPKNHGAGLALSVDNMYAPLYYYISPDKDGYLIKRDLTDTLMSYTPGNNLTPADYDTDNHYVVEIVTDDAPHAGTTSELFLRLDYLNTQGEEVSSRLINLKDSTQDYYGYWPGKGGDAAYSAAAGAGGTLVCDLDVQDVDKFTGFTISMSGKSQDDWQMKSLVIYRVSRIGERQIVWKDIGFSDREITRELDKSSDNLMADYVGGTVSETGTNPKIYLNANEPSKSAEFGENSKSIIDSRETLDWGSLRYSMSFKEAMQDLGFSVPACDYEVQVKVASNSEAGGDNGDCGSQNLFYFKLNFEGGSSAYVLANQQLSADGFRADRLETFHISTNRDYGSLASISIIPEDSSDSDNQDPFDKLNIDYINVIKKSDDSLSRSWKVENVGWIDVNYRDKGAENTMGGRPGRTEAELAHVRSTNYDGYSMNFLVEMKTDLYLRDESDVNRYASAFNPQFKGSMVATIEYYDQNDALQRQSIDVVRAIYEYINVTPQYYKGTTFMTSDGRTETRAMSDPDVMFRGGHTDRFFVTLPDVKQIVRVRLGVSSEQATVWNLENVVISSIEKGGALQITENDEYIYSGTYKEIYRSTDNMGYPLQLFKPQNTSETLGEEQEMAVVFNSYVIPVDKNSTNWSAKIDVEPKSQEDKLNIYVYLQDGVTQSPTNSYNMSAKVGWSDAGYLNKVDVIDTMNVSADGKMFYYTGFTTTGFQGLNSLTLTSSARTYTNAHVDYAVIQQVRSGVVMHTYYLNFGGLNAENKPTMYYPNNASTDRPVKTEQKVRLFFSPDMAEYALNDGVNNVAVAIRYKTKNDAAAYGENNEAVYSSRNVFLSRQGYEKITPGMIAEVSFNEDDIAEIVGVTVSGIGNVSGSVEGACVGVYNAQNICKGWYNFAEGTGLDVASTMEVTPDRTVVPVKMSFETGESAKITSTDINSGLPAAIRMKVSYVDVKTKDLKTLEIEDINDYLVSGSFQSGSTAEIEFFMKDVGALRSVTLEPYTDVEDADTVWGLNSFYCEHIVNGNMKISQESYVGADGNTTGTMLAAGKPRVINLSDISISLKANSYNPQTGMSTERETPINGSAEMSISSGGSVTITPKITGNLKGYGFKVKAVRIVDGAEQDVSYWENYGSQVVFTPPENNTANTVIYKITISSEEVSSVGASLIVKIAGGVANTPVNP